jgi:hypothetical protein
MTINVISAIMTVGIPIPSPTPRAILSLRSRPMEPVGLVALFVGDGFAVVALKDVGEVNGVYEDVDVLVEGERVEAEDVDVLLEELVVDDGDEVVDELAAAVGIVARGVPALMENAPSVPHWH